MSEDREATAEGQRAEKEAKVASNPPEPELNLGQQIRVKALNAAREVLASRQIFGSSPSSHFTVDDILTVAEFVLYGAPAEENTDNIGEDDAPATATEFAAAFRRAGRGHSYALTPIQWADQFLLARYEQRLEYAEQAIKDREAASQCYTLNHDGLSGELRDARAEIRSLQEQLEQQFDALGGNKQ